jgi:hypothetical protein
MAVLADCHANSMDRSAGVDVKGRNTYCCTPKETLLPQVAMSTGASEQVGFQVEVMVR